MAISVEKYSELVLRIYETALDASCWEPTLEQLAEEFGARMGALLVAEPGSSEIKTKSVGMDPAAISSYNDYYGRLDPVAAAIQEAPAGMVIAAQEVFTRPEHLQAEFQADWAIPNHISDGIFARLTRDRGGAAWVCFAAPRRPAAFATPERLRLMRFLVPHLQRTVRVQAQLTQLGEARDRILEALEHVPHGVVLMARDGRVLFASSAAIGIFDRRDGILFRAQQVQPQSARENAILQRLLGLASGGSGGVRSGGCLTISRPSGRQPLVLHVLPLGEKQNGSADANASVLLLIIDPERQPDPRPSVLRQLYGLTAAETAVAARITRGDGLQSVADELAVSLSTARTQLQKVFEKTGTHRQAELVRLLLNIEGGPR
ncbi:hypothetical protein [Nitratireductor sp. ZSWI3]|uniref:helix-turn-helix transcriptional regulator n=1 Tax=Nitratireductor sp. ZSWI3 TaxID=2966359 RepID=UPI00214F6BE2|nr:hypothetical protein [Nitratireductor sp. ZSWI3]MCR4267429.1 hypothetical protein [Nitratireductor sp. ZSWI3]